MSSTSQPSKKEAVRAYLQERQRSSEPPPSQDRIRERMRELMGWAIHREERITELAEQFDYVVSASTCGELVK